MTRDEFIDAHRHELGGIVLDAILLADSGAGAKSLWLRSVYKKIDQRLALMYAQLTKHETSGATPVPGKPVPTQGEQRGRNQQAGGTPGK